MDGMDDEITITPADMATMYEQLSAENAMLRRDNLQAHTVLRRLHVEVGHLREVVAAISQQGEYLAEQWQEPTETDPQGAAGAPNGGSAAPEVPQFSESDVAGLAPAS